MNREKFTEQYIVDLINSTLIINEGKVIRDKPREIAKAILDEIQADKADYEGTVIFKNRIGCVFPDLPKEIIGKQVKFSITEIKEKE